MLLLSLIIFPFVRIPDTMNNIPRRLQPIFDEFISRWVIATISNSLLATLIFVMVFVMFAAFISSIKPIGRLLIGRRNRTANHAGHAAHA
jgi:uncharacterized membrane protein